MGNGSRVRCLVYEGWFNHLINQGDLGPNTQQANQIAFPHSPGQGEAGPQEVVFATGNHDSDTGIPSQVDANALVGCYTVGKLTVINLED